MQKSRQSLLEAEVCYWVPLCFFQLWKAYNLSATDAIIESCISMATSALIQYQLGF